MMKKIKLLFILISCFYLTGCYNYRELNELSIASSIGLDKTENGVSVTVQVINAKKEGSDNNSSSNFAKIIAFEAEAETVQEALRSIVTQIPRRLYLNHLTLLVIGEDLAKEGLDNHFDFLARDPESRKEYHVVVAKDAKANDVLKILTGLETVPSEKVINSLNATNQYMATVSEVTLNDFLDQLLDDKQEISLPVIKIVGNEEEGEQKESLETSTPKANLIIDGMAVFKDNKLIGYLDDSESKTLTFLKDDISNALISYYCSETEKNVIELNNSSTDIEVSKNELKVKISVKGNGNISEINCPVDLEKEETIEEITESINKRIEEKLTEGINNIINKYNTDVLGFRLSFYRTNPNYYKTLEDNWYQEHFKNLEFEIKADIELEQKGAIIEVIN